MCAYTAYLLSNEKQEAVNPLSNAAGTFSSKVVIEQVKRYEEEDELWCWGGPIGNMPVTSFYFV